MSHSTVCQLFIPIINLSTVGIHWYYSVHSIQVGALSIRTSLNIQYCMISPHKIHHIAAF